MRALGKQRTKKDSKIVASKVTLEERIIIHTSKIRKRFRLKQQLNEGKEMRNNKECLEDFTEIGVRHECLV